MESLGLQCTNDCEQKNGQLWALIIISCCQFLEERLSCFVTLRFIPTTRQDLILQVTLCFHTFFNMSEPKLFRPYFSVALSFCFSSLFLLTMGHIKQVFSHSKHYLLVGLGCQDLVTPWFSCFHLALTILVKVGRFCFGSRPWQPRPVYSVSLTSIYVMNVKNICCKKKAVSKAQHSP